VLGGVGVGVQRVRGDDRPVKVQVGQQRHQAWDLARGAVDAALGQHRAGGVVHRGEQMDLPAVAALGAPQRLAVDRDRPPPPLLPLGGTVAVGQPGAEHCGQRGGVQALEGAADGGLGRHHPVVGALTAGTERGTHRLGGIGGPLGDRGDRPGAGQDRGGGHGEDRGQRVAAAAGAPGIVDGGEVGEQLRGVGWSERVGVGERGQGGWDRG
jgi:hypothetical protein